MGAEVPSPTPPPTAKEPLGRRKLWAHLQDGLTHPCAEQHWQACFPARDSLDRCWWLSARHSTSARRALRAMAGWLGSWVRRWRYAALRSCSSMTSACSSSWWGCGEGGGQVRRDWSAGLVASPTAPTPTGQGSERKEGRKTAPLHPVVVHSLGHPSEPSSSWILHPLPRAGTPSAGSGSEQGASTCWLTDSNNSFHGWSGPHPDIRVWV